jgi:hypothetical protein
MRKVLLLMTSVALLFALALPVPADDVADARAVVKKAVTAMGGEARLSKYKATTAKTKGTYYGMGAGIEFTEEMASQLPKQMRLSIDAGDFKMIIVANGDKGWRKAGGNTEELQGDGLKATQDELYAGWVATLVPLDDRIFTLKPLGDAKVGEHDTTGVKVEHPGRPDVSLYFGKKSGRLYKVSYRTKDEMSGQEVTQEQILGNYKEIDGIQEATKITINRDGKLFVEEEITELKHLEKLDDSTFAMP